MVMVGNGNGWKSAMTNGASSPNDFDSRLQLLTVGRSQATVNGALKALPRHRSNTDCTAARAIQTEMTPSLGEARMRVGFFGEQVSLTGQCFTLSDLVRRISVHSICSWITINPIDGYTCAPHLIAFAQLRARS